MQEQNKPSAKPKTSAFRRDLVRGLRWGMALLLVMLLSIAAYRVLSSSPAVASQAGSRESEEQDIPKANAITVGEATAKQADAASAPRVVRRAPVERSTAPAVAPRVAPRVAPQVEHIQSRFPAVLTPKPANAFVAEPLPVVVVPAPDLVTPGAGAAPSLNPPPTDNGKQANRATRAVRSVGRIFGIGRKKPEEDESKKK
jgi:hypothetical protein